MQLITIDRDKCKQDGICAAVCPAGIIDMSDNGYPAIIDGADEICIKCGHCVAVCPTASFSHRDVPLESCTAVEKDLKITDAQAVQFLRSRRSIRRYKNKPVSRADLERLINVARYAPSGHNVQPVEWLVFGEKAKLKQLSGIVLDWMHWMLENRSEIAMALHLDRDVSRWNGGYDVVLRDAPVLIAVHAQKDNRVAPAACTIALAYLELAATAIGMGACWAGYFNAAATTFPPLQEALALPKGHQTFGAMIVGYPQYKYPRMPGRKTPKITWRM